MNIYIEHTKDNKNPNIYGEPSSLLHEKLIINYFEKKIDFNEINKSEFYLLLEKIYFVPL